MKVDVQTLPEMSVHTANITLQNNKGDKNQSFGTLFRNNFMRRLFSLNGCFRFLISQAFNLFGLTELAENFQFSYNISVYPLQHLVAKRNFLYFGKCLQCISPRTPHCAVPYAFKKLLKMCINHYPVKTIKVIPRNPIQVNICGNI